MTFEGSVPEIAEARSSKKDYVLPHGLLCRDPRLAYEVQQRAWSQVFQRLKRVGPCVSLRNTKQI